MITKLTRLLNKKLERGGIISDFCLRPTSRKSVLLEDFEPICCYVIKIMKNRAHCIIATILQKTIPTINPGRSISSLSPFPQKVCMIAGNQASSSISSARARKPQLTRRSAGQLPRRTPRHGLETEEGKDINPTQTRSNRTTFITSPLPSPKGRINGESKQGLANAPTPQKFRQVPPSQNYETKGGEKG